MNTIVSLLIVPVLLALLYFLLPAGVFPVWVHTGITDAGGYLKGLNDLFDVNYMLTAMGFVILFEIVILTWRGVRWLFNMITGAGA